MLKKILSTALVTTIMIGNFAVPTKAANSTSEDGSLQSLVTAQVASSWVVTVPDSITLDANKSANYEVSISGDVADDTSISIIPESSFTLTDGSSNVTANVTQEKQQWIGSEIEDSATSTTGSIVVADEMTAGTWAGSLNFNVNCTEDLGDLLAKIEMMSGIDLYCLGDSVIDGYMGSDAKSYYGTAEAVNSLYGTRTFKNFAVAGACLTNIGGGYRPTVYEQMQIAVNRIKETGGMKSTTAIVFNGGGNDILVDLDNDDRTLTIDNHSNNEANGEFDLGYTMTRIFGMLDSYVENYGGASDFPIIYIIPKKDEINSQLDQIKGMMTYAQSQYPNLLIIDYREFITESDMSSDHTHLNSSGQTKLAHKIVDVLYDYYN